MIVYRKQEETTTPAERLKHIRLVMKRLEAAPFHEIAMEFLMEWGVFESALTDAVSGEKDTVNDLLRTLRKTAVISGRVFASSWEKEKNGDIKGHLKEMEASLDEVSKMELPESIRVREPEGYAHYGLYPETYIDAAKQFYDELKPGRAVCIGLRSIGASLSAVIAGTLEGLGCEVIPFTMRPQGHPFARYISLSKEFESELKGLKGAYFLIADEGPGLSGTSFSSAARKLHELGVDESKIIFFPSWCPGGEGFISQEARRHWPRHRKYSGDFTSLWIKSGRLSEGLPKGELQDISGGWWRTLLYEDEREYPAVHPHHEKRKYLFNLTRPNGKSGGALMMRFAGHGRYGRAKYERAKLLSEAGFIQPVKGFKDGFLITDFIKGRPLNGKDINQLLLDKIGEYLSFLKLNFTVKRRMDFAELMDMAVQNTKIGLGEEWGEKMGFLGSYGPLVEEAPPVALDGRMLPNEWLLTHKGYMKADAFDHHSDQFFPCCQDICWDLAGTIIEFNLNPMERNYFLGKYRAVSGDKTVGERLPFHLIAYLAYRLGYCTFAADELGDSPDGVKFRALVDGYSARLRREILSAYSRA